MNADERRFKNTLARVLRVHPRPSAASVLLRVLSDLCVKNLWFPMTNTMKRNEAKFCRPASVIGAGFTAEFATRRRQDARIMSPEMGPPAATTICNCFAGNDLRK